MRTNINLATQPYEDAREYVIRWASLVLLLLLATAGLVWFTVHSVRQTSDISRQLARARNDLATLDREKVNAERMLALPKNRGTVDKSEFLNSLFARKAFSWTTVFSDMEKLMPPGLRVLSIAPALDEQNQLQVHIVVGGESRDRAIELMQNLEKTPRFHDVRLISDQMNVTQNGSVQGGTTTNETQDPIRFDIVANYTPTGPAQPAAPQLGSAAKPSETASAATQGGRR
jgi:type IV pilus assembly protein PilN